jgi:hypothetical protein
VPGDVHAQVAAEQRTLKAEAKRGERELATVRTEVGQLTGATSRATGAAADALLARELSPTLAAVMPRQ